MRRAARQPETRRPFFKLTKFMDAIRPRTEALSTLVLNEIFSFESGGRQEKQMINYSSDVNFDDTLWRLHSLAQCSGSSKGLGRESHKLMLARWPRRW